ncbi:phage tail tape measure protein [Janibacter sp. LM]|uniref:phage tail tape measure protein n=1 Tax=Janibacter sp. LM TaxID=3144845 RepID=UPI0031F6C81B
MSQVISTTLEVNADKAVQGFDKAGRAAGRYGSTVDKVSGQEKNLARSGGALNALSRSVRDNRAEMDRMGTTALVAGGAVAAGLGLATKANIAWESSWAGVTKTVDGSSEQMADLEEDLRGLAKELPATHTELAAVAEAAGQLGVAREDIIGFTETAVALGESTNLSADEAATSLAKFSNVMGTAARDGVEGYERMGAALVALGNDGASTEADIMQMALRLSGAGKQIGASEADVLALANALSSVGIEAELGGGAMSRALLEMNSAVIGGGEELEAFAEIAGVSASDFAAAWRADPVEATNMFIAGLGRIGESGGDAASALSDVGLKGTQNAQVLLRAAGASDLVTESLKLGATAWEENAALAEEAGKRYETTESKLQIAKNTMTDAAIDLGAVFGPVLAGGAEKLAGIADAFVKLPEPVQKTSGALAGVAASGLLIGGAAVKIVGWSQDIGDAFDRITTRGADADGQLTRTGRTVRGMAKWGGYAAGAYAVATAIGALAESGYDAVPSIEDTTKAILGLRDAQEGEELSGFFDGIGDNKWIGNHVGDVDNLADAYARLENPALSDQLVDWKDNLFPGMSSGAERVEAGFTRLGESLAAMPADDAAMRFERMVDALGGTQTAHDRLLELMPAYRDQLTGTANDAQMTGDETAGMNAELTETEEVAEDAETALDDLAKAIDDLGATMMDVEASHDSWINSVKDVDKSFKENGRVLEGNSAAALANRGALRDLVEETQQWAASTLKATGDTEKTQDVLDRGREKWIAYRDAVGLNEKETRELADALFSLPEDAVTDVKTTGAAKAKKDAENVKDAVDKLPPSKLIDISESGASGSMHRVMALDESITTLDGKTVLVGEDGAQDARGNVVTLNGSILGLSDRTVQVTEVGSTAAGGRVVRYKGQIYEIPPARETIFYANTTPATTALGGLQQMIDGMSGRTIDMTLRAKGIDMGTARAKWAGGIEERGVTRMEFGGMRPGGSVAPGFYPTSEQGILMAEDTRAPWELYASGRADLKDRSRDIIGEGAARLGGSVTWDDEVSELILMATGGVYSRWQSQLRNVRALADDRRYRWEDGSRMISVFEDGTARWGGWSAAPQSVTAAINALNTAQDAYEDELRRPKPKRTPQGGRGGSEDRDSRTYQRTPRPSEVATVYGGGGNTYATAHIENLHGINLDDAMREAHVVERRAALSRRNT